jgi:hypothetical protein
MINETGPKPLVDRPLEELQSLLAELESDEAALVQLKNDHPEIAELQNDDILKTKEHKIWQSIQRLEGVKHRISRVRQAILGKTS